MSLRKISVSFVLCLVILALMPTVAQEDNPDEIVKSFYTWYLDYTGYDEDADVFRNPIVDGYYRDRAELNPALIASIDAQEERFADPFLCAQDLPESAQFEPIDSANVLVNLYFGNNPHAHTLLVELDDDGLIENVNCMETVTADGTVRAFYQRYIEDRDAIATDSPLLTDALNAQLNEILNNPIPSGEGDPVVCAQDRPSHQSVTLMTANDTNATVLVREFFANNPEPHLVAVDLVNDGHWQIDTIRCEIAPQDIAAYLYNEFALYRRYDVENNTGQVPLIDWTPYPWNTFMDTALYSNLQDVYASSEPRPVDPFLCVQDLPDRFTTAVISGSQSDSVAVQISGVFPTGPDSFDTAELAVVTMTTDDDGNWQMSAITCTR